MRRLAGIALLVAVVASPTGCGSVTPASTAATSPARTTTSGRPPLIARPASNGVSASRGATAAAGRHHTVRWAVLVHDHRPLDIAGPDKLGRLFLAAGGGLWILSPSGRITSFARAYRNPGGEEPYIALASGAGCFEADTVYAIRLSAPRGVVVITPSGRVHQFAKITAPGLIDGIAFDHTGDFHFRLLVTIEAGTRATVDAIDCHGRVSTITRRAPRIEGGIVVANSSFGKFAGDLLAPDELSGRIYAITPRGKAILLVRTNLPHGQDIGVESLGFFTSGRTSEMVMADRLTPGNRHPGDDVILVLRTAALLAAGARPDDLLAATEGGGLTDAIRCTRRGCTVREVAIGPKIAHIEGHIAVLGEPA